MLSEKELRDHFNMPLNEVARKFGMCTTALKKLCRKYGVMQWPHRKLRSLEKKIASLRAEQVSFLNPGLLACTADNNSTTNTKLPTSVLCVRSLCGACVFVCATVSQSVSPSVCLRLVYSCMRECMCFCVLVCMHSHTRTQRYTSDGGVHHHIDDEIRKLQQQREMLLNGDGQLHDGDWGGMGDDGDFDDGGGGLSRNNSHNSLSSLSSAQPAPGGGTRGGAGSRETMNELVMTLEEENQSLRALTRSVCLSSISRVYLLECALSLCPCVLMCVFLRSCVRVWWHAWMSEHTHACPYASLHTRGICDTGISAQLTIERDESQIQ